MTGCSRFPRNCLFVLYCIIVGLRSSIIGADKLDLYVSCELDDGNPSTCTLESPCSSIASALDEIANVALSGPLEVVAVINILPGVCDGPSNVDLSFDPTTLSEVKSNATVYIQGSFTDETVVDCGCDFVTNCIGVNHTRAFIMGLRGIVSVSDLTVRNCGGKVRLNQRSKGREEQSDD